MNASDFSKESISQSAFFTGHRFLKHEDLPAIRMKVDQCVSEAYESGYRRFFCGCALGFDTVAAFRVIFLKKQYPDIRLSLAIPCATQAERWDPEDRKTYDQLLQKADFLLSGRHAEQEQVYGRQVIFMHLLAQQYAERNRIRRPVRDHPQANESH